MLCKFRAATSHFFFPVNEISMELARSCCLPRQRPSLCLIFLSVIGLWVKIWYRNKTAYSKSNPVQSSRSESTTCLRKGRLLRFQSNSAATSDGGGQKLGNDVRRDSEPKFGLQMKCDVWKPCCDQRWQASFNFWFEDFLSNLPL